MLSLRRNLEKMKHLECYVQPYIAFPLSLPDLQNKTKPKLQISLMLGIAVFLLETSKCAESNFWVYVHSGKLVPLAKGWGDV